MLQKIIASSGAASRRKAEELIRSGQVKVNGRTAIPGDMAEPDDDIRIGGRPLEKAAGLIYIKLNKPVGYTCTNRTFPGEKNIFDLVRLPERLFAVGRLDKASHGLVLLTNDGDLTQKLTHPKFEHEKKYEVEVAGDIKAADLIVSKLRRGVDIGEGDGVVKARGARHLQKKQFIITLSEGKKRQIRRMFKALGLEVSDLKRISIGPLSLGNLPTGKWAYLGADEIKILKMER